MKRNTRQEIIDATRRVLATEGLKTVTMRRIAKEVGISAPSIYRHFESRDAMVQTVIAEGSKLFASYLFHALGQSDPLEQLIATGMQYLKFAFEQETVFGLMFATWNELSVSEHSPRSMPDKPSPGFQFLLDRVAACLPGEQPREALLEHALEQWAMAHGLATLYLYGGARQAIDRKQYQKLCGRILQRAARNLVSQRPGSSGKGPDPAKGSATDGDSLTER